MKKRIFSIIQELKEMKSPYHDFVLQVYSDTFVNTKYRLKKRDDKNAL